MVNHPKFFGWESFGMVRFDLWTPSSFFCVVGFDLGPPPSRSNKDSQT